MTTAPLADQLDTFPGLLARNAVRFADRPAYREKEFGIWQSWTWAQARDQVEALAKGLLGLDLRVGDHVAIIGSNRPALYMAMISVQSCGAIPVPVYQDAVADEMAYVLDHCGARFVIAEDQEQVDKVLDLKENLPGLEQILYLDPRGMRKYDHSSLNPLDEVIATGRGSDAGAELAARQAVLTGTSTCVMLYTSGTTGRPKGVVLSNDNILVTAKSSADVDQLRETDSVLAYLPCAWVGDFIFSMGQAHVTGFCVACPESSETMQHDLREIGPTYFFAPPRFFEGLLTNVMIRMEDATRLKRWLFRTYMDVAKRVGPAMLSGG